MNIKQLSAFTGKDERTIRRWIAKAGITVEQSIPYDKMSQAPHDYTIDDIGEILTSGTLSKDAVSILMENARNQFVPAVLSDRESGIDYEAIGKMIGMAVTAALSPVVDRLDRISQQKAIPEPVKEDFYSLVAYCKINEIQVNRSELAMHGRELKKMARSEGLELKKIPDERWGTVNSYPVVILNTYFAG